MSTTAALVVDIVDLPHQIGSVKDVRVETAAPADLGTDVIGVPEGSPVVLDAQLTSMEDGVLARGRADVRIHGRCVRCLRDLDEDRTVAFDELYYLPRAAEARAADGAGAARRPRARASLPAPVPAGLRGPVPAVRREARRPAPRSPPRAARSALVRPGGSSARAGRAGRE